MAVLLAGCGDSKGTDEKATQPVAQSSGAEIEDGRSIDWQNVYNHRVCIASGGIWDPSVVNLTSVDGHPFVGWCRDARDGPICRGDDLNSRCWSFVHGGEHNETNAKALPAWRACKTNPPDPMC